MQMPKMGKQIYLQINKSFILNKSLVSVKLNITFNNKVLGYFQISQSRGYIYLSFFIIVMFFIHAVFSATICTLFLYLNLFEYLYIRELLLQLMHIQLLIVVEKQKTETIIHLYSLICLLKLTDMYLCLYMQNKIKKLKKSCQQYIFNPFSIYTNLLL